MPSDCEGLASCLAGVLSVFPSIVVGLRFSIQFSISGSLELEELGGVSAGVKVRVLGLTEVSVSGLQDEGDTGCLSAFLSLGNIRSE